MLAGEVLKSGVLSDQQLVDLLAYACSKNQRSTVFETRPRIVKSTSAHTTAHTT